MLEPELLTNMYQAVGKTREKRRAVKFADLPPTLVQAVLSAEDKAKALEARLFEDVRQRIAGEIPRLQRTAESLARLDVLLSLARVASERGYVKPVIVDEPVLEIVDGKHPVLDQVLGSEFVPNDVMLGGKAPRIGIITGPNMAGKSTYIRQGALLALMAHMGSWLRAGARPLDVHGRDDRDRQHPEQRHRAQPRDS